MKILFMGTPDFARASLEALIAHGDEICAVVTQTDKPVGRKHIITPSAVKVCALSHGIPVYQPKTLKNGAFDDTIASLAPEMIVVAAYGKLLPESVINYPRYGCINVHGSLLPKYRGAAPIQRAMLSGDDVTGVTTMYMDVGMDTGDILLSDSLAISDTENLEQLYARLAALGASLLCKTIDMAKDGTLKRIKQEDALATVSPKLTRDDEHVDFNVPTKLVMRKINCMLPSPGALTSLGGKSIKIFAATALPSGSFSDVLPSHVAAVDKHSVSVKTADGAVAITELMEEGGKRMSCTAYLCGRKVEVGTELL